MRRILVAVFFMCLAFTTCSQKREKIINLAQLEGKQICVLTGSAGDLAARKAFPDAEYQNMIMAADAALSVKTGKADAFIHNKTILANIISKDEELIILEHPVSSVTIAGAVKKNNKSLLADINSIIALLNEDGTLDLMKQKWVDAKYQSTPELPALGNSAFAKTLVMGTCAKAEPLSFISNSKITGFDIELALRIGDKLNAEIEIIDMTFESLIHALQSGKIDFALSNFNVTEERKQFVDFSEAYLENEISALVKK